MPKRNKQSTPPKPPPPQLPRHTLKLGGSRNLPLHICAYLRAYRHSFKALLPSCAFLCISYNEHIYCNGGIALSANCPLQTKSYNRQALLQCEDKRVVRTSVCQEAPSNATLATSTHWSGFYESGISGRTCPPRIPWIPERSPPCRLRLARSAPAPPVPSASGGRGRKMLHQKTAPKLEFSTQLLSRKVVSQERWHLVVRCAHQMTARCPSERTESACLTGPCITDGSAGNHTTAEAFRRRRLPSSHDV